MYLLGIPLDTPHLRLLRAVHEFPSLRSCQRYINKYLECGHWQPKYATGNHDAEREVRGQALVNLALYRVVHPESPLSHARAFLFNVNPTVAPFSHSAVLRAEAVLDLRRKVASTTCERAYWAINLRKREQFWHEIYPHGRADVLTSDMIDMDQAGMKIEASNPRYGKTVLWQRSHFDGSYNRDKKLNLMMAISADRAYNMEWHEHWEQEEGGTNLFRVYSFYERVMDQLDADHPGRSFCFTMDNLNIHHNQILLDRMEERGHRYLFRAPYWSVDGPMEYIFNTIHVYLLTYFRTIPNLAVLGNRLDIIIGMLDQFMNYFINVGFPDN